MFSKELYIKIPGNSGCNVEVISYLKNPAIRKQAVSVDYVARLRKQREKQEHFRSAIEEICIPKVLYYDDTSFVMEYLPMLDSIEFFEIACPQEIRRRVDLLFQLVVEELRTAKSTHVSSDLFLGKLKAIQRVVPAGIWQKYYIHHVQALRAELPERLVVPIGQCHGDLTFSNVMFSLEEGRIGLLDFLDSFLESPIVDIVKMRQDTRFNWTNRRYIKVHDTVKISILMSWLDGLLELAFSDVIHSSCFRIVEKMNYFRIAPYAQSVAEHQFLSRVLEVLIDDASNSTGFRTVLTLSGS